VTEFSASNSQGTVGPRRSLSGRKPTETLVGFIEGRDFDLGQF